MKDIIKFREKLYRKLDEGAHTIQGEIIEVEALPARQALCQCKHGIRGALCLDYHPVEEAQEPQKSVETDEELHTRICLILASVPGISEEDLYRNAATSPIPEQARDIINLIRAERERKS